MDQTYNQMDFLKPFGLAVTAFIIELLTSWSSTRNDIIAWTLFSSKYWFFDFQVDYIVLNSCSCISNRCHSVINQLLLLQTFQCRSSNVGINEYLCTLLISVWIRCAKLTLCAYLIFERILCTTCGIHISIAISCRKAHFTLLSQQYLPGEWYPFVSIPLQSWPTHSAVASFSSRFTWLSLHAAHIKIRPKSCHSHTRSAAHPLLLDKWIRHTRTHTYTPTAAARAAISTRGYVRVPSNIQMKIFTMFVHDTFLSLLCVCACMRVCVCIGTRTQLCVGVSDNISPVLCTYHTITQTNHVLVVRGYFMRSYCTRVILRSFRRKRVKK